MLNGRHERPALKDRRLAFELNVDVTAPRSADFAQLNRSGPEPTGPPVEGGDPPVKLGERVRPHPEHAGPGARHRRNPGRGVVPANRLRTGSSRSTDSTTT